MSADTEMERKICDCLKLNGKSTALMIANEIGSDRHTVNKHLYNLETSKQVFKTDEQPPVWDLMEKKNETKPEQKSETTREEKDVEDLLRSGALKAHQIATELRQPTKTIKKQLYSMEKKKETKPEQKSETTREEKDVEDMLRSGALKAHQIATELGQPTKAIKKQLYSMEKKGTVQKCSNSSMWSLNEERSQDSFSQERYFIQ